MQNENKSYFTILAKPTYACNMRCSKCYLELERDKKKGVMTDEILNSLIMKASRINSKAISIQWIGGESLLVGIEFYERAAELINQYTRKNQIIEQFIQTNASLINDDWISFIKDHNNIAISISFEITQSLQEKLRPLKSGHSSYDIVKNNIQLLNERNVPYGTLTVITRDTIKTDPYKWLNHTIDLGIKAIGLQICYQDFYWGEIQDTELCMEWINKLFKAQADYNQSVYSKDQYIIIRESYYLYHMLRNCTHRSCSCQNTPSVCSDYLLSVDIDGSIYGYCDAFMGTNASDIDFYMGNIVESDFETILASDKYDEIRRYMDNERKACSSCNIYRVCNGGCPLFRCKNIKAGIMTPSEIHKAYCMIQKGFFSYLLDIEKRALLREIYHFL